MMLPLVEARKSIDSIPRALVVPKYSITVFAVATIVLFVASGSSSTGTLVSKPIEARASEAAGFSSAAGRFPLPLTAVGALIVEAGGVLTLVLALALVLALVPHARAAALRRPSSRTFLMVARVSSPGSSFPSAFHAFLHAISSGTARPLSFNATHTSGCLRPGSFEIVCLCHFRPSERVRICPFRLP